ncbi:MAG: hypothetical protein KC668_29770 [Myxococcales bacterium]|nr:hypothetical protein [Myxococcales bacterium]
MTLGDLHKVPRLGSMPEASALYSGVRNSHAGSDEWFEQGGSVPPPGRVDPTSRTIALQSHVDRPTAPSARPSSANTAPSARPSASTRSWVLAIVGLVVGLLIAVGGFLAFRASQADVTAPTVTPGAPPAPPAVAASPEPSPAPTAAEAAPAPEVAEPAAAPTDAVAETGTDTAAPSDEPAEASMAPSESSHRSRSSSRPRTEATMAAPSEPAPMVDMSPPTPTLESNPYTR